MKNLIAMTAILALAVVPVLAETGQIDSQTFGTMVNLTVAEEVSMWADASIDLVLEGNNQENSDAAEGSLGHINNVPADISVAVDGMLDPNVNFFLFDGGTAAEATAAMEANANDPAGALKWTSTNLGSAPQAFTSVAKSNNVASVPVVYAADAPNALPDPDSFALTVTWTIAPGS